MNEMLKTINTETLSAVNYRHPKGMAASLFIPNNLPLPAMVGGIEVVQSKLISFLCSGGTRLFNVIRPDIL